MPDTDEKKKDNDDPSVRLKKKEDLMLFLALHMEESPKCKAPPNKKEQSVKYNKCGIVVTTGDKMKRIVTMDCSRNELHAVEVVMMNFPRSLKGGNVFLSRKPCYRCTQLLIQGEFSSVYYWPWDPEQSCITSDSSAPTDSKCVDQMFLRSKISFECLVPDQMKNIMMADNPEKVKRALCCLDSLLPCSKDSFLPAQEQDRKLDIHALQLCFLLAARSDDLHHGVGTVIYNEMGYIIGCGYNGYVTGATYGNFSRDGQDPTAKASSLVHAEANALLLRSQKDLDKAVLYSSKKPCVSCKLLIEATGITEVIFIDDPKEKKQDRVYEINLWKPSADAQVTTGSSTPATSSSTPDSSSSTPASSSSTQASSSSTPATSSSTPATSSSTLATSSIGQSRLQEKDDLCMLLALYMEYSTDCEEPAETEDLKYCKSGVVICEPNKPKWIVTIDCSRKKLHAVQQALLNLPNAAKGCEVFLSRKPCCTCVKLLIQGQVSRVCYWPDMELHLKNNTKKTKVESDAVKVGQLFSKSCITAEIYIPLMDFNAVCQNISQISKSDESTASSDIILRTVLEGEKGEQLLNAEKLLNAENVIGKFWEKFKMQIQNTEKCMQALLGYSVGINHNEDSNDKKYMHALNMCYLMAARTECPGGTGTLIYKNQHIVAAGYNGFPKGTSIFSQTDNDHGEIAAEANALLLGSPEDMEGAIMFTTTFPCETSIPLIKGKKIKEVVCSDQSDMTDKHFLKEIELTQWKQRDPKDIEKDKTVNPC